jgi:DNA-binding Lrp family transcriptional regulator
MTLYDYPITDEIKELGFSRVYKKDKNLVIYNSPALITSRYFSGDLQSTLHHLENALVKYDKYNNNHFGTEKIERFLRWFAEVDIKTDEAQEDAAKEVQRIETLAKHKVLDEINELRAVYAGVSSEEWRTGLLNRFDKLKQTVQKNIPDLWVGLEFELSCMRVLNIHGCTLPIIAIILGRAAGGKTQVISLIRQWPFAYYTDTHSSKSWVSHTTSVKNPEDLEKIDMLPMVKNRIFCTPEWAPIFTLREEDLRAALGVITRIADGQGLASNSGVYGRRAYEGTHMFTWIGAAVDVPHLVYKVLGTLGQKLYFFRLPFKEVTTNNVNAELGSNFNAKFNSIQAALFDYHKWFEIGPDLVHDDTDGENEDEALADYEKDLRFKPGVPGNQFKFHDDDDVVWKEVMKKKKLAAERREVKGRGSRLLKMKWDSDKDDPKAKMCIAELAVLLSHLRCDVQTWSEGGGGTDIGYSPSLPEHPQRAAEILFNLAKGHALLYGRNYVTMEDIPTTVKTVMSTAQIDRVKIFSLLLADGKNWLPTSKIIESFHISPQTARRRMKEFEVIGLVDEEYSGSSHELAIKLKPKFSWFLSEEFNQVRAGFEPADYRKYLKEKEKQDDDVASEMADPETPSNDYAFAYEKMIVFDKVFDELVRESQISANMEADKDTVGRGELRNRLVSSGVFNLKDASSIIDIMLRIKRIKQVKWDTYRRANSNSNGKEDASS